MESGGPTLSSIGPIVAERVDAGCTVAVVIAPGSSGRDVSDRIQQAVIGNGSAGRSTECIVGRRGGATAPPADRTAAPGRDVVRIIVEAQWLPDDELERLLDDTSAGALVVVHRAVSVGGGLARLHAEAFAQGARFELEPTPADDLVGDGWSHDDAEGAIAATGGWPDLVEHWRLDRSLASDVTVALSLLDEAARAAAELLAFGATPGDVAPLLGLPADRLVASFELIECEGLTRHGLMPPGVAAAVCAVTPVGRRARVVDRLLGRSAPGVVVALAEVLARLDDRSDVAAGVHLDAARELIAVDPIRARFHLEAATAAGAAGREPGVVAAELELLGGDPAAALRCLGEPDGEPDAQLLAATAWYALGDIAAAADALGSSALPELEVWARLGAGEAPASRVGGAGDATAASMGDAVRAWQDGRRDAAFELLGRAMLRSATTSVRVWPTTPHSLAALLASRLGDVERAGRYAETAVADRVGGPMHRRSEVLLAAWCAARQGRLDDAATALDEIDQTMLSPRERWMRAIVACALAVRDPEPGGLEEAVSEAADVLARRTVDLYDLELVGEVAAAFGRVGGASIDEVLRPQEAGLDGLGRPADLVFDVAWIRLVAALCTDDVELMSHAARRVLEHPAPPSHHEIAVDVARLVAGCADGEVDVEQTIAVATRLADSGRVHEAARLCGVAAVRTADAAATRRLLKQSRGWRLQRARLREVRGVDRTVVRLSAQEERVAHLVDDGLTYKAIAAELFISPKTVEHHVAHVRSKLGAGSRAELLGAIRAYFGSVPASSPS